MYQEVKAHLQGMANIGIKRPSQSLWASPTVIVRKKDSGLCSCIDLRKFNGRTVKDSYTIPKIEETLECLHAAVWCTSVDLKSGYWQLEMKKENKPLEDFSPVSFYEYEIMPFRLMSA